MAKPREMWGDALLVKAVYERLSGALYHVTDLANIPSVDAHGLLSKRQSDASGVHPAITGGNELTRYFDNRDGLNDFVFLALFADVILPNDAGQHHSRQRTILEIAPEILLLPGVEVRLGRGARAKRVKAIQAYYEMDWEILEKPELRTELFGGSARWNTFYNYEVLVPKCVPREYLR